MYRLKSRTLLWGGLLGLLAGCGQVPGGTGTISGVVSAPAGGDVSGTEVFACFANEDGCERLGLTIEQAGATAAYRLSGLPSGSYGVYALKDADSDGVADNGDFFGYYSRALGEPALVRPPATGIDIEMTELTGAASALPRPLREPVTIPVSKR